MSRTAALVAHSSGGLRDELQFAVAFHLNLTSRLWRVNFADRTKSLNQSEARWTALYMISDAPAGIIQTHLAQQLGVQGPTVVRLLDALEKQGLINRRLVANDRRAKVVTLETKGREMLVEMDRLAAKMRDELFLGVSQPDIETTLGVLRHLSSRLEASAGLGGEASPARAQRWR